MDSRTPGPLQCRPTHARAGARVPTGGFDVDTVSFERVADNLAVLPLFSPELVKRFQAFVYALSEDTVYLASEDPQNFAAIDYAQWLTRRPSASVVQLEPGGIARALAQLADRAQAPGEAKPAWVPEEDPAAKRTQQLMEETLTGLSAPRRTTTHERLEADLLAQVLAETAAKKAGG